MGRWTSAYTHGVSWLLRPYIRRELPGWGMLYRTFIGSNEADHRWAGHGERWVRGKLHHYEMSVRISGWSNRATFFLERFYDLPTQLLMQHVLERGDTFVDIGANEGMMTLLAARLVGPGGKVVAFEPSPVPRAILERNLERNGIEHVRVHSVGLGDRETDLQLLVPDRNSGEATFTQMDLPGKVVTCPVKVADAMLRQETPKLIKIDVEGFETRVLTGLSETIARSQPLISIEMIAGHLQRDGSSPAAVCALFRELGYVGRRLGLRRVGRSHRLTLSEPEDPWSDGDYVWGRPASIEALERRL
ncbi:FkbM family methyltransferase [Sphingomonas arenae]|uniref:FkbM family methyltransferase n=1 Tax=Sphingomonas arenae TaxID=2812555 RepID=UPI0019688471|nr:FkbM family methyltransferase [Sphingomonas arenae]